MFCAESVDPLERWIIPDQEWVLFPLDDQPEPADDETYPQPPPDCG